MVTGCGVSQDNCHDGVGEEKGVLWRREIKNTAEAAEAAEAEEAAMAVSWH